MVCLRSIPQGSLQKSTKSFRLSQSIGLLTEILEAYEDEPYRLLSEHLGHAKVLAETRNLIAHNPLLLEFYERPDGSIYHQEVIAAMHRDRKISLAELKAFADEAEVLASALYAASSEVFRLCASRAGA